MNIDLQSKDKKLEIIEKILEGYEYRSKVRVEIIDAGSMASMLNNNPHLREAYFRSLFFKTWETAWKAHGKEKGFRASIDLIARDRELNRLKSLVDDPHVRVVLLGGPPDIGKSRMALEGTRHRPHDVVLALDPRSTSLGDYRALCRDIKEIICIIEDPDQEELSSLINEALSRPGLKLIITFPSLDEAPLPGYGFDDRAQFFHLDPLDDGGSRKLLKASGRPLTYEIEEWLIEKAGGNPGVLLAGAMVGEGIREASGDFIGKVGSAFEKLIRKELGDEALKCVEMSSVMTHVGVSGKVKSELEDTLDIFGEGLTAHQAHQSLEKLETAGFIKRGGSYVEITMPPFGQSPCLPVIGGKAERDVRPFRETL